MIIKDIKVKLLRADKLQGMSKEGKPFMFYVAHLLDEDANVLRLNLSNDLSNDSGLTSKLEDLREKIVTVSISLRQSGFGFKANVVKLDTRG